MGVERAQGDGEAGTRLGGVDLNALTEEEINLKLGFNRDGGQIRFGIHQAVQVLKWNRT